MIKPFFSAFSMAPIKYILSIISILLLMACNPSGESSDLKKLQDKKAIVMGTINSSLTYSYDGEHYSGLDYELGKKFATYLNLDFTVKEFDSIERLIQALDNKSIDFAGAGLTLTPKRAEKYRSSPPYYHLTQTLVYRKGNFRPKSLAEVNAPIYVLKSSSHEETIKSLQITFPNLQIIVLENEDQESLLQKIAEEEIKFAIVDSTTLAQSQRYYPLLAEALAIKEKQPVAWLMPKIKNDSLYAAMIEFMGEQYESNTITKLEDKYFGHISEFDFVDTRAFLNRIESRLPKYEALFKKYATDNIPWLLLASISYQESHWDPNAVSPTGVRGMMMLTLDTAKFVGIKNRRNAEQSIQGGAKYLSQLINRVPDSIPEDEKIWFALASYNIGLGHVLDVRRLATMRGQNPDSWVDVKENLPLLHQRQWYTKTRYGYARGLEAKHYVDNIREYLKTLTWHEQEKIKAAEKAKKEKEEKRLAAIELEKQLESEVESEQKAKKAKLVELELEKQAKAANQALITLEKQTKAELDKNSIELNSSVVELEKQTEEAKNAAVELKKQVEAEAAQKIKEIDNRVIDLEKQVEEAKLSASQLAQQAQAEAQQKIEAAQALALELEKKAEDARLNTIELEEQAKIEVAEAEQKRLAEIEEEKQKVLEQQKQAQEKQQTEELEKQKALEQQKQEQ
ncbi:membrane-bound lytic murein transglycosylase MltF [Psychromonas aquatilis]|uniref:Membrane-bound lytic murein transglycosylase F n=1 Tax=Psychromonas aquatilis TaxID=2005072 RepID=A0ABU9GKY7_9GAMM